MKKPAVKQEKAKQEKAKQEKANRQKVETGHLSSVTRSLAVNAYLLRPVDGSNSVDDWFERLQSRFTEPRLANFLIYLGEAVGAKIINLSSTLYEPYGASAALLVAQELDESGLHRKGGRHDLAHLDASHIAAHSYFDCGDHFGQFRLEVEISTCGNTHPHKLVGDILAETGADFAQLDYRTRGISWALDGRPRLARDDLKSAEFEFENYHTEIGAIGRSGYYAELTKVGLDRETSDIIEQMLAK